mmetsp:Transcript_131024/g.255312  ORF Transcript_131024/g.255312 Transcript_131024/m.255312 type:complete len:104 (+) Transcript_131024:35-346(+)
MLLGRTTAGRLASIAKIRVLPSAAVWHSPTSLEMMQQRRAAIQFDREDHKHRRPPPPGGHPDEKRKGIQKTLHGMVPVFLLAGTGIIYVNWRSADGLPSRPWK